MTKARADGFFAKRTNLTKCGLTKQTDGGKGGYLNSTFALNVTFDGVSKPNIARRV